MKRSVAKKRRPRHIQKMASKPASLETLSADNWWIKGIGTAMIAAGVSAAVVLSSQISDTKALVARIDGRLDSIERRLDRIENKVDRIPTKTGSLPMKESFVGFRGVKIESPELAAKALMIAPKAEYWIYAQPPAADQIEKIISKE